MRQYAYSLAAQEFAAKITGHTACRPDQFCAVMEGYDAGAASVTVPAGPIATALSAWLAQLAPHSRWNGWEKGYDGTWSRCDSEPALLAPASPPIPAPVLLTADDPRWRDGAKVRGEWPDGSVCEGWLQTRTRTCATYCTMPSPRLRSLNSTTTNSTTFSATSALLATTS